MPIQTQRLYEQVLDQLRDRLVSELGAKIEAIVVYGSVARREDNADSDIDVLIISSVKKAISDSVFDIAFDIDLKYETLTTLTFYTPEEFLDSLARGEPLLREVLQEGQAIYGDERFQRYRRALQASR